MGGDITSSTGSGLDEELNVKDIERDVEREEAAKAVTEAAAAAPQPQPVVVHQAVDTAM